MAKIIVQKFGGTSLAGAEAIRRAARRVVETRRGGCQVVVVVSAMDQTTDELLALARQLSPDPPRRELDVLLATGEQASMALMATVLAELGQDAVSLSGAQCGIVTNPVHGNARILKIHPERVRRELALGRIVVVAGFQGVTDGGDVTTLGRGGSDTTAVALAAALGAERCEIYTDVEGVFSADPRVVPAARPLTALSSTEMEELAWHGAQVLKAEAVEFAAGNGVSLLVASNRGGRSTSVEPPADRPAECYVPRRPPVAGVAGRRDLLRVRVEPGALGGALQREIFTALADYDLVFGGLGGPGEPADLLLSEQEMPDVGAVKHQLEARFDGAIRVEPDLGAVSLVGFGLGSRPASLLAALELLRRFEIPVYKVFTGRESLTFLVPEERVDEGMRELHRAFVEAAPVPLVVAEQAVGERV